MSSEDPTRRALEIGVRAARDRKALDLVALDVARHTSIADYFVVCHGTSDRQVLAIADAIEDQLRSLGKKPLSVEGRGRAEWVLIDFGDLVFHVFLEERRRWYGLERLWGDATDVADEIPDAIEATGD